MIEIKDDKIYLVLFKDENNITCVSHGVGNNSLRSYCLPQDPLSSFEEKKDLEGYYLEN